MRQGGILHEIDLQKNGLAGLDNVRRIKLTPNGFRVVGGIREVDPVQQGFFKLNIAKRLSPILAR